MPEQAIKVTCPHCGKVRTINPAVFGVSKGPPSAALEKAYQKKRASMLESGGKSGSWTNLRCPSCGQPYQFNTRTHKARPKPSAG
jgi:predicted RNA-binding Zn-ribbon protein involved in translation (DUF1610 family)